MIKKSRILKSLSALSAAVLIVISASACKPPVPSDLTSGSGDDPGNKAPGQSASAEAGEKSDPGIVNIGVTSQISSLNPLLTDSSETAKYAQGLNYVPLVELNADNSFEYMLAESITTEDGTSFRVKLSDAAVWSDGKPVTADDVVFTAVKLTSDVISNPAMSTWFVFKGLSDDAGTHPDSVTEIEGIKKVDDKNVDFICKDKMTINTFMNTYARYLMPIPEHVYGKMSTEELKTTDSFSRPEVVSGPYVSREFDGAHYVSYEANPKYFRGAPKINKLNIKVVQGSQLLIGLKTGEIDFVQQTMASFAQEDLATLEALDNIDIVYDKPLTNQLMFINNASVPDKKLRQALLRAIDRKLFVSQFLNGKGEVVDGFLTSFSPFFDETLKPVEYSPEEARKLAKEADQSAFDKTYTFKINSGDSTFVQAVNLVVQQLGEIGLKVNVVTEDIGSLLATAGKHDFDFLAVQYTLAPVDPFPDITYLMTGDNNWVSYKNPEMDKLVASTQSADEKESKTIYGKINRLVQEDVPLINLYSISSPGAVSKKLKNAEPHVYGFFNNIQDWESAE